MSEQVFGRGVDDSDAGKPRNKRRYDDKQQRKQRPGTMDRIRARWRNDPEDDDLDDLDDDLDIEDVDGFEDFDDDDDDDDAWDFEDEDDDDR